MRISDWSADVCSSVLAQRSGRQGAPHGTAEAAVADRQVGQAAGAEAPIERRRTVPLSLEQWDRNTCSWPIGDPKTESFSFCGDHVAPGRPYCTVHCAKAYTSLREHAA